MAWNNTISPGSHLGSNSGEEDPDLSFVILGSSLGAAFEWYDFFVYGTLAVVLGPLFFSKSLGETGAFLASLATYGTGLLARPIGSAFFGQLGDRFGRKHTFIATISLMGAATALIGVLPTYETAGVWATVMLVTLRCIQGFALGGEYGGAATYVAEHSHPRSRGYSTGWLQLCTTGGFLLSLVVVLTSQRLTGDDFRTWGWRIPFLASAILVIGSIAVRMKFLESPVFRRMQVEGTTSRQPLTESFANLANMKLIVLALLGLTLGAGIIWYTSQFYALIFLQKTLKVEPSVAYLLMAVAVLCALPFYVVFGKLSDRIGRKPVLLAGLALALLAYIPLFQQLTHFVNPTLELAMTRNPVVIESGECRVRFLSGPTNDCERMKDFLVAQGIQHTVEVVPTEGAVLRIGSSSVLTPDPDQMQAALAAAGYPSRANSNDINYAMALVILFSLALLACASYGVLAAYLVELFPARIRYTSISMPYHIGGYFGGFMLYFATLISSATGNIFDGLWYSIALIAISLVVGLMWVPETRDRDIYR